MPKLPLTIRITCWLICAVFGTIILIYAKNVLLPIVISAFLSFLLYPVYKRLIKWKFPAILSVIVTMLLVIILMLVTTAIITTQVRAVVYDIGHASGTINAKLIALQSYISNNFHLDDVTLANYVSIAKDKLMVVGEGVASGAISTTTDFMSNVALIVIFIFCFLLYNTSFRDFAFALMGDERHNEGALIINNIQRLVQNYLVGLLTVILIIGTLNSIGLLIIGVDHAIFFAFFAAMLTVIPYIGITIGASFTAIYLLLTKDTMLPAFGALGIMISVQLLESNFITPKIVGSKVSVNPFVAVTALLVGGELWGIPGMALSIPITAVVKLLMDVRPQTKAFGYFLGSEFTDKKTDPSTLFGKQDSPEPPKK